MGRFRVNYALCTYAKIPMGTVSDAQAKQL